MTTQILISDRVAESILEASATAPGTLIAMTMHSRTGLQRLFIGSVADKVIRNSSAPTLVYRPVDKSG